MYTVATKELNLFSLSVDIVWVKNILWYCGLGLWCLTPLSTIFQLPVYHGNQFLLVEESGVPRENHSSYGIESDINLTVPIQVKLSIVTVVKDHFYCYFLQFIRFYHSNLYHALTRKTVV